MVRAAAIFFALLSSCCLSASQIVYMTLPKGGSHLMRKALSYVEPLPFKQLPHGELFDLNPDKYLTLQNDTILYHHLEPGFTSIKEDQAGHFIKMVMIRDPRDVIVSMCEWIKVMAPPSQGNRFLSLTEEEQIEELIVSPDLSMNGRYPFVFDTVSGIKLALEWMENPTVLICRFEDLVGPLGGGSEERQKNAIGAIAYHLHVPMDEHKLHLITHSLFGDTCTFRKGAIGSWKQVFTERHKKLFKERLGKELIALGYEQDDNW